MAFQNGTRKESVALQQGEALSCRASPLRKQFTELFSNSPLAERTLCLWGSAPHPVTLLKKGQSKTFSFLTGITAFDIKPQSVERIMVLFSERLQTFRKQNRRPRYVAEIILSGGLEAKADKTLRSSRLARKRKINLVPYKYIHRIRYIHKQGKNAFGARVFVLSEKHEEHYYANSRKYRKIYDRRHFDGHRV